MTLFSGLSQGQLCAGDPSDGFSATMGQVCQPQEEGQTGTLIPIFLREVQPSKRSRLPKVTQKSLRQEEKSGLLAGGLGVGSPCLPCAAPRPAACFGLTEATAPVPDSDELFPVLPVESSPSAGPWKPAPLKDFAPVIIPSPASSIFPSPLISPINTHKLQSLPVTNKQTLLESHTPSTEADFLCLKIKGLEVCVSFLKTAPGSKRVTSTPPPLPSSLPIPTLPLSDFCCLHRDNSAVLTPALNSVLPS